MQVLSKQIFHQNRCLVLGLGSSVWKIPISPLTWAEAGLEKNIIAEVAKDSHFSPYLPSYKFLLNASATPHMKNLAKIGRKEYQISTYFKQAFSDSDNWLVVTLNTISDTSHFRNFVERYLPDRLEFWRGVSEKLTVRKSSAHGDFHIEHIFADKEKLFFIDWTLYSSNSSRYFDLINFWIFSQKKTGESWMDVWKKNATTPPAEISGIQISASDFAAYAVWKVAAEVKLLSMRNRLNDQKQRKYMNFINYLKQVWKL